MHPQAVRLAHAALIPALSAALVLGLSLNQANAADLCKDAPRSSWKSVEQAKKAVADLGHPKAVKVILEDGCYKVVTLNADGKIVRVLLDPVTLQVAKVEAPR